MTEHEKHRAGRIESPLNMLNGDTPWYVRVGMIILFYYGFPTILVGVLFAMGAGWIPSPITATHRIAQDLEEHVSHVRESEEHQLQLMGMICRNTSFTSVQQAECQRIVDDAVRLGRSRGRRH